ncbi:DUF748 domain-containing protein [Desulfoferula mesophila]|uniref:DUF748 domain-containing protein n=1 Tax=Desulfoferula mesophila TaxID=3058419 RepID=UPI0030D1F8E1
MAKGKARRWPWISAGVVLALVGLYAAAGFWGVPYLIKSKLPAMLKAQTGQSATLGEVRCNPFTLCLEADDFVLGPGQERPLASIKHLMINLEVASLWRWALICTEASLEEPFIKVVLSPEGDLNLARLAPAEAAPAAAKGDPFPFLLRKLNLLKGSLWFLREQKGAPGQLKVIPINLELQNLSTLKDLCGLPSDCGPFSLTAASSQDERLEWRGKLSLSPVASSGRVRLQNWKLATLYEVVPDIAKLAPPQGLLDFNASYEVSLSGGGVRLKLDPVQLKVRQVSLSPAQENLRLNLESLAAAGKLSLERPQDKYLLNLKGLQTSLRNLTLGLADQTPMLTLSGLEAGGVSLDLNRRLVEVESLKLNGGRALTVLDQQGKLNWSGLLAGQGGQEAAGEQGAQPEPGPGWSLRLKQASLENYGLAYKDQSGPQPKELELQQVRLGLDGLAWPLEQPCAFDLESDLASGGKLAAKGRLLSLAPDLEAEYQLEGMELKPLQPYLDLLAKARIAGGILSSQGKLALGQPAQGKKFTLEAGAAIDKLSLLEEGGQDELVGWDKLSTPQLRLQLEPGNLGVDRAELVGPRVKMVIGPQGQLNLLQAFKAPEEKEKAPATPKKEVRSAPEPPAFAFHLGVMHISKGQLDFSDLSLKPEFSSVVRDLRGSARDVGNVAASPMPLRLRGRVDRYGQANITGRLLPLSPTDRTQLKMEFENLDMHHLSPYAAKFAGWRIKEGKLYAQMDYRLEKQRLVGDNQVLIKDLVLGEKINEPGAPDLPLDLAVALLKDSEGRIKIALPVTGDLADPQVSVSGIIGEAIINLIVKIVTAPFTLLANLVGASDQALDQVDFDPGSHRVSPPEEEKLAKLAKAMQDRPQLKLGVAGGYNPGLDTPALQRRALVAQLGKMTGQNQAGRTSLRVSLSSASVSRALEALYLQRYSRAELNQLKKAVANSPDFSGKTPTDQELATAQTRAMFRAAVKKQPLGPEQIKNLAESRASAVAKMLTGRFGLAPDRLTVSAPVESQPTEDKNVPSPLSLVAEK